MQQNPTPKQKPTTELAVGLMNGLLGRPLIAAVAVYCLLPRLMSLVLPYFPVLQR